MDSKYKNYLKKIQYSQFFALVFNYFMLLIAMLLCRAIFLWFNIIYFDGIDFSRVCKIFYGGVMFDFASTCFLTSLSYFMGIMPFKWSLNAGYQKIAKWYFVVAASLGVVSNLVDTVYFRFSGRRSTISVFHEFSNEGNIGGILLQSLVDYWYLVLLAGILIFVFAKYSKMADAKAFVEVSSKKFIVYSLPFTLLFIYLFLAGVRGSLCIDNDHRPINLNNANAYIEKSAEASAVLNTPFSMIRTMGKKHYKNPEYFNNQSLLESYYTPIHQPKSDLPMIKPNIVVIILESFGKEYSGFFNPTLYPDGKGYTPFLDSLYQQGLTFTRSFATGRKSIDAMPSILAGVPYLTDHFFLSVYSNNNVNSIASLLNEEGYHSAFFHGAPNGSMGFENFARLAGFGEYYGLDEYCADSEFGAMDDFDGYWAIWDEEFLQYYAKKMGELPQPFATAVFTASSHHPFRIPQRYSDVYQEGPNPITKCIQYSDNALRLFFEKMKAYPWYTNTIFVITADHTNQILHPEYSVDYNLFSVPILFYWPGSNLKGIRNQLACQSDIMPTLLDMVHYPKHFVAFGQSLLQPDSLKYIVNFNDQTYNIYQGDYFLLFDGDTETGFYNYIDDPMLQNNLKGNYPDIEEPMLNVLKAEIQQYNVRMIENRLTMP